MTEPMNVFIVSNPGFFNKGDAALVQGAIMTLRNIKNAQISMVSKFPVFEAARTDVRLVDVTSRVNNSFIRRFRDYGMNCEFFSFAMLWRVFGFRNVPKAIISSERLQTFVDSDLIVGALDDSFTTIYGRGGFLDSFQSILLAKMLKKPVVLYAGSIGPFQNKRYERLARFIINKTDLVTLREDVSFDYLKKIGVTKPKMVVTADLAFALSPASRERAQQILESEGTRKTDSPLIGVSLSRVISQWAFPEISNPEEKYRKYVQIMAQMLDHLIEQFSATLVFIPQVIGPTSDNDDRVTAAEICRQSRNSAKIHQITTEYTAEELRALTGCFDLFVGARTHSVISAAMMGVPFLAIEYESHKTRGIIGNMLQCPDLVYDIKKLSLETLLDRVDDLWKNRDRIKNELAIKTRGMRERALLNGELVGQLLKVGNNDKHVH